MARKRKPLGSLVREAELDELDDLTEELPFRPTRTNAAAGTAGMSSARSRKEKRRESVLRAAARERKASQPE
jgi:hypothetical protein